MLHDDIVFLHHVTVTHNVCLWTKLAYYTCIISSVSAGHDGFLPKD